MIKATKSKINGYIIAAVNINKFGQFQMSYAYKDINNNNKWSLTPDIRFAYLFIAQSEAEHIMETKFLQNHDTVIPIEEVNNFDYNVMMLHSTYKLFEC